MLGRTVRILFNGAICGSAVAVLGAGSAQADKRNPAPIIYAGQGTDTAPADVARQPQVKVDSDQRIVFRYPGTTTSPVAAAPPRQFAALPQESFAPAASNKVVEDAMAEPKAPISRPVAGPIRIAAARPETPSPVGKPLTLSRVSANRDATLNEETGRAGLYTEGFDGHPTANGEIFDSNAMTAAHPTLPLPSLVQVTNTQTGREIVVRVNDRGPFAGGRVIELTERAGRMIGINDGQTANVRLRYLGPAPVKQVDASAASVPVREEPLAPVAMASTRPAVPTTYSAPAVPAPVTVAAATPELAGDTASKVFIQAGSFADIGNAQRLSDALGRRLPVEIQQARVRNADYFRVMIGPFDTRHEAETYRDHLSQAGIVNGLIIER